MNRLPINLEGRSEDELRSIADALGVLAEKKKYNYLDFVFPATGTLRRDLYPKHLKFFQAGEFGAERAFIAANRVGKTFAGLYEMILHCTGRYPEWWPGKRFTKPVECWLVGETGETIRDTMQQLLVGQGEMWTGLIPKACVARDPLGMAGISNGFGQYFIKHSTGGVSRIVTKSYNSGIEAFKGAAIHVVMLDEQCPLNIYTECQMRTVTTSGIVYLTFTPDNGATDTVLYFMEDPSRFKVKVGWKDVPHIPKDVQESLIKKIPPHLIPCKTEGEIYLGTGAVYPISESQITEEPFKIPSSWPRCFAFDPGWNKTAALWAAYDTESDVWHLYSEYYAGHAEAAIHAKAIRARGRWIPGIADPYTEYGSKGKDGISFLPTYEEEGLQLMMANNKDKDAGIFDVYELFSTGRLKVANTLKNFLHEYKLYRRDDNGRIVKKNDHLMDCLRYLIKHGREVAIKEPNENDSDYTPSYYTPINPITGY